MCSSDLVDHRDAFRSEAFRSADVAIEFTRPDTAFDNYMQCFAAGVPVALFQLQRENIGNPLMPELLHRLFALRLMKKDLEQ